MLDEEPLTVRNSYSIILKGDVVLPTLLGYTLKAFTVDNIFAKRENYELIPNLYLCII